MKCWELLKSFSVGRVKDLWNWKSVTAWHLALWINHPHQFIISIFCSADSIVCAPIHPFGRSFDYACPSGDASLEGFGPGQDRTRADQTRPDGLAIQLLNIVIIVTLCSMAPWLHGSLAGWDRETWFVQLCAQKGLGLGLGLGWGCGRRGNGTSKDLLPFSIKPNNFRFR